MIHLVVIVLIGVACCCDLDSAKYKVSIIGKGYHRRVSIDVLNLNKLGPSDSKLTLLAELISNKDYYIDLDQAKNEEKECNLTIYSMSKVEVEKIAISANFFQAIAVLQSQPVTEQLHFHFNLHLRYQAPNSAKQRYAKIPYPDIVVYLQLSEKFYAQNVDCDVAHFSWGQPNNQNFITSEVIKLKTETNENKLIEVPVGLLSPFVTPVTLICVFVGTVYFLSAL